MIKDKRTQEKILKEDIKIFLNIFYKSILIKVIRLSAKRKRKTSAKKKKETLKMINYVIPN